MSKGFEKLRKFVRSTLSHAPGSYPIQVDLAVPGDLDRGAQALAIVPVIEGRQAITARIGRGERSYAGSSNPVDDRSNVYVGADAEGPGRKLDEEDCPRMLVVVAGSAEADGFHDRIKLLHRCSVKAIDLIVGGKGSERATSSVLIVVARPFEKEETPWPDDSV